MQGGIMTRRMQYSSCDECRRSRVGCDAASRGSGPDSPDGDSGESSSRSCTRCLNRQRPCTFKWIKDAKGAAGAGQRGPAPGRRRAARTRDFRDSPPAPPPSDLSPTQDAEPVHVLAQAQARPRGMPLDSLVEAPLPVALISDNPPGSVISSDSVPVLGGAPSPAYSVLTSPAPDRLSTLEADWLQTIYRESFEAIFGSWMGRYSCPFLTSFGDNSPADKYISIADLCGQLDRWMAEAADGSPLGFAVAVHHQAVERDAQIDLSLRSAIAAFSARWLPITTGADALGPGNLGLVHALWRHARRDMLRVINRPSYRSMITLFLFALTPIPAGISEEEEVDGISGQACVHAALQQIQTLRARQRNLQFSGSKVSPSAKAPAVAASPASIGTPGFIGAESMAYWAALTFDTSASLTLNCRSLLSSGLFGFEAESSWQLVRTCAKMFDEAAQHWRQGSAGSSLEMTDERANQIVAAAAAWKLLGWKLTAVFKEALRDGHDESEVRKAYEAVVDSIKQFNSIFRHRLEACQRRMPFLGQQTRLRWYTLMLHYHLSILMMVDIIEATGRYDLLVDLEEASTDAETAVMNTLVFGLHNTFTMRAKPVSRSTSDPDYRSGANKVEPLSQPITVPLVAIDPYPHHVVAGVQLLRKAVDRDFGLGKVTEDSYTNLVAMLERTLSLLPQCSKSVQAVRTKFAEKLTDGMMAPHQDPYVVLQAPYAE